MTRNEKKTKNVDLKKFPIWRPVLTQGVWQSDQLSVYIHIYIHSVIWQWWIFDLVMQGGHGILQSLLCVLFSISMDTLIFYSWMLCSFNSIMYYIEQDWRYYKCNSSLPFVLLYM